MTMIDDRGHEKPGRRMLSVVVIVLAISLPMLLVFRGANTPAPVSPLRIDSAPGSVGSVVEASVNAFSAFTLEHSAERDAGLEHQYTADGLRLLAVALDAVLARDSIVVVKYRSVPSELRADADRLQRDPTSLDHAAIARGAFLSVAEAVSALQRHAYPSLDRATAQLRDAAGAVRVNHPLLSQRADLDEFYLRASDVLRGMLALPEMNGGGT